MDRLRWADPASAGNKLNFSTGLSSYVTVSLACFDNFVRCSDDQISRQRLSMSMSVWSLLNAQSLPGICTLSSPALDTGGAQDAHCSAMVREWRRCLS